MQERQKRILYAILAGLLGAATTGFVLSSALENPVVAWIIAAVSFFVVETASLYSLFAQEPVSQRTLIRWGAIFVVAVTMLSLLFFVIRGAFFA